MKDVTSTSFGIIIAFVLPGLVALYSLSFWSSRIEEVFGTFLTVESNVGLFFLVLTAAVILGLQVTLIRWLVFECIICSAHKLDASYFNDLGRNEHRLMAFRALVDEHYRYHQFWGGMTVVIPVFVVGWLSQIWSIIDGQEVTIIIVSMLAIEILTGCAAHKAYVFYSNRAKQILAQIPADEAIANESGKVQITTENLTISTNEATISASNVELHTNEIEAH